MQRRAVVVGGHILRAVEIEHAADRCCRRRAERADRLQPRRRRDRLVRHVEPDHGERDARLEHDMRGVRIGEDVELGGRGDIAGADGPAHRHDLAHIREHRRVLDDGECDIGKGPKRGERNRLRCRKERLDQEIDRVGRFGRVARFRQVRAVYARGPVDALGGDRFAHQGARAAGIDGHLRPAAEVPDPARIALGQRQRDIAGYGRDAQKVELFRRGEGQQQGDGVVLAGVAIDDQRARAHTARPARCPSTTATSISRGWKQSPTRRRPSLCAESSL